MQGPSTPQENFPATSSVLLASLLLPGLAALTCIAPTAAVAQGVPDKTTVAIKYGSYSDSQPGWDRITATSPQFYVQTPIAGDWALEASGAMDTLSGATPRWYTQHTAISGASQMNEQRRSADVKITRYLSRFAYSVSVSRSVENDYTSNALGLDARLSSDDNNRTWSFGWGHANDTIDATASGGSAAGKRKTSNEFMAGLTQVLTISDVLQFNLTRGMGSGYYSDPYKTFDSRPDYRNTWVGLVRWDHYVEAWEAALRTSYRYYSDSFGVESHTVGVEWAQVEGNWTITPGARYYSQSAANFYLDPLLDAQGQYDQVAVVSRAIKLFGASQSTDQRLAAFGALAWSIKFSYAWNADTQTDLKLETYRQSAELHLGGTASPGLDPFSAKSVQIGLTHRF